MQRRYGVLRLIGTIFKILGILVGLATLIGAIGFCALGAMGSSALNQLNQSQFQAPGLIGSVASGIAVLIVGAIYTLTLYAIGDGISLLLALEENTRLTATLLQQNVRAIAAPAAPSPAPAPAPLPSEKP